MSSTTGTSKPDVTLRKTSRSHACRWPKRMLKCFLDEKIRTTLLLYLASIVEKADEAILPAVYKYMGASLHATPTQLGTITLCRGVVQVVFLCPICPADHSVWLLSINGASDDAGSQLTTEVRRLLLPQPLSIPYRVH